MTLTTDRDEEAPSAIYKKRNTQSFPSTVVARLIDQPLIVFFIGLLLVVFVPSSLIASSSQPEDILTGSNTSLLAIVISYMSGFLMVRRMSGMPGTRAITSVFPALIISFGLTAALFFGFSLPINRYEFVARFGISTLFLFSVTVLHRRLCKPTIGLVPYGRTLALKEYQNYNWVVLERPEDAEALGELDIAVDFRATGHDAAWERYLTKAALKGRKIYASKILRESLLGRVQIDHLAENPSGQLAPDALYSSVKRYGDFFAALVALIVLSPVMLLTALIIRLETTGPSLFKQSRTGFRGDPFTVYKFRSMTVIDEATRTIETDMTQSGDNRITRVGRFIRKTRIDELPQLFNILKGEMSLIGPRPETLRLSEWYEAEISFYHYRHIVRPGITGWAQVNQGHVVDVDDVKKKLEYDLYYVRNFSIWLDLLIILKTVRVILTGHGAK